MLEGVGFGLGVMKQEMKPQWENLRATDESWEGLQNRPILPLCLPLSLWYTDWGGVGERQTGRKAAAMVVTGVEGVVWGVSGAARMKWEQSVAITSAHPQWGREEEHYANEP